MGTNSNNEKLFHDKIVDFADTLSPEDKKKLLFILGTYTASISNKDTAKILFGEDSGYFEEIDSAPESDGEIGTFGIVGTIVKTTKQVVDYVTKSSRTCVETVATEITHQVISKMGGCPENPKPENPKPEPCEPEPTKPKGPSSAEGPGDHVIP